MAGFIQNIIWNSVEGFVEAGSRTAGEYAGNALIKAGDMIENSGRSVGNGIEKKATSYGTAINGQTYKPSAKPLPSTARKPAIKRSNSLPANTKTTTKGAAPLGANKYPGSNQVNGAKKAVTSTTNTARGTVGNATKTLGGVTGGVVGGGTKALNSTVSGVGKTLNAPSTLGKTQNMPKPYPNTNNLPKPYGGNAFGNSNNSGEKKTAVRAGAPKPFVPPVEQKKAASTTGGGAKPNYPGQGSRVPVQNQKMKALPRLGPQVTAGQEMKHLAI